MYSARAIGTAESVASRGHRPRSSSGSYGSGAKTDERADIYMVTTATVSVRGAGLNLSDEAEEVYDDDLANDPDADRVDAADAHDNALCMSPSTCCP